MFNISFNDQSNQRELHFVSFRRGAFNLKSQIYKDIGQQIQIQKKTNQYESESLDSIKSVFNSDYDPKPIIEIQSRNSIANSIYKKNKIIQRLYNSQNVNQKLVQLKRIQSFRLDEDVYSFEEEESLPENLMDVNLYFRQDAIVSVQKILQTQRKLS